MDISLNRQYDTTRPVQRVYLWGMPGAGKSTVGRKLAAALGWNVLDLDAEIERQAGKSVLEIFSDEGEPGFRQREWLAMQQTAQVQQCVVAVGGGAPCQPSTAEWMTDHGLCITLTASSGFIAERLWQSKTQRPLLADCNSKEELKKKLDVLLDQRIDFYQQAHISIPALNMNVGEVVSWIASIQAQ